MYIFIDNIPLEEDNSVSTTKSLEFACDIGQIQLESELIMGIIIAVIGVVLIAANPPIGIGFIVFCCIAAICGGGKKK
jgi:hypothetical protein